MRVKTKDLNGLALDWAVAQVLGVKVRLDPCYESALCFSTSRDATRFGGTWVFIPSRDWRQGGPIIEREAYNLFRHNGGTEWCCACNVPRDGYTAIVTADGTTPLVAAMRCYVLSRLGDTVDIPDNLIGVNQILEK